MTHYFFAFTLAAGLAWLWFEPSARPGRRRVTVAVAVALALCSAWLPMFIAQYRNDRYSWIGPFDARETIETPLRIFSPLVATPATGVLFLAWLLVGVRIAVRRGPLERLCAVLALVPLLLAGATWVAGVDVFAIRNLIGIGPFVAVVFVLPLTVLRVRRQLPVAVAVAAAATALFLVGQRPTPPFNAIAAALVREGWRPADSVVVEGGFYAFRSPLEWYLPHVPQLVRGRVAELAAHPAFAVAGRRTIPRRLITGELHVGRFLVARVRPEATARWLRRGVVLSAPPERAAAPVRDP